MAFNDLDPVSGYWLGPHWFGSPSPDLLAMPLQGSTAYRNPFRRGGEAVVTVTGVVLFDFNGLEPERPTTKELAATPFSEWPRKAAGSVVAPRRVELLNAPSYAFLTPSATLTVAARVGRLTPAQSAY